MMNYIGIDGNIHSDELKHWKYIKKIKSGSGWRYFYTPEEVRAYYKEEQGKANAQYEAKEAYSDKIQRELQESNKWHRDARKRGIDDNIYATNNLKKRDIKDVEADYRRTNKAINLQRKVAKASHTIEREKLNLYQVLLNTQYLNRRMHLKKTR